MCRRTETELSTPVIANIVTQLTMKSGMPLYYKSQVTTNNDSLKLVMTQFSIYQFHEYFAMVLCG